MPSFFNYKPANGNTLTDSLVMTQLVRNISGINRDWYNHELTRANKLIIERKGSITLEDCYRFFLLEKRIFQLQAFEPNQSPAINDYNIDSDLNYFITKYKESVLVLKENTRMNEVVERDFVLIAED